MTTVEHAVLCGNCLRRDTWNLNGICDDCTFDCGYCRDERVVEERVYGRFAVEATRVIRCPRCRDGKPVRSTS